MFKSFAGTDLPNARLRQAMIDDVVGLLDYYTWTEPSRRLGAVLDQLSFARDARLAKMYGVAGLGRTAAPPEFPAGARRGC